jgi:hypothetical protein
MIDHGRRIMAGDHAGFVTHTCRLSSWLCISSPSHDMFSPTGARMGDSAGHFRCLWINGVPLVGG